MACPIASSSRNQIKDSTVASFCPPVLPYSIPRSTFSPCSARSPVLTSTSPWPERFSRYYRKTTSIRKTSGSRDNFRKLAIKNCLIKMGGKAAEVAKTTLIIVRPSLADQRRRLAAFKRRPSPLSVMSKAQGCLFF